MITTIIFDIGGVLGRYNWRQSMTALNLSEEAKQEIEQKVFRAGKWSEVDRNVLSDDELEQQLCDCVDVSYRWAMRDVFRARCEHTYEYPFAAEWVKEWHDRGFRILVLSNYSRKMFEEVASKFSFWKYVDGQVISYQEGLIKPEPEIYQTLKERYSLVPEECIFIDDLQPNLEAAQKLGFHTVHAVRSHEETAAALEQAVEACRQEELELEATDIHMLYLQKRRYQEMLYKRESIQKDYAKKRNFSKNVICACGIVDCIAAVVLAGLTLYSSLMLRSSSQGMPIGYIIAVILSSHSYFIFITFVILLICTFRIIKYIAWLKYIHRDMAFEGVQMEALLKTPQEMQELYASNVKWIPIARYHEFEKSYNQAVQTEIERLEKKERAWREREYRKTAQVYEQRSQSYVDAGADEKITLEEPERIELPEDGKIEIN